MKKKTALILDRTPNHLIDSLARYPLYHKRTRNEEVKTTTQVTLTEKKALVPGALGPVRYEV